MSRDAKNRTVEQIKWHIARYDGLQATAASRASTVLSADAIVLTAIAIIVGQSSIHAHRGQSLSEAILAGSILAAIVCVISSIVFSSRALLALRPWRVRFGKGVPPALFYMHNDTLMQFPTFATFRDGFLSRSVEDEIEAGMAALWARTKNFKNRNDNLRRSILALLVAAALLSIGAMVSLFR